MKKLIAVALASFAISASAEWKTVGTVQVADSVTLAKGVTQLGEFTGNAMLGMMAAGAVNNLPGSFAFGPGRSGVAVLYPFFVENGRKEFAVLYPVAITKEAFIKKWPGAVESNGIIRVTCPFTGKKPRVHYAAFSEDGKWAGLSDKPLQARLALAEIATAEKSLDGDLFRMRVLKPGLDEMIKSGEESPTPRRKDLLKQLSGFVAGVRVTDKGLDIRGAFPAAPDSEISKLGPRPLAAKPLSFAEKDALVAFANAANCGSRSTFAEYWKEVVAMLEEDDIKVDWLRVTQAGVKERIELDPEKFCKALKTLADEADEDDRKSLVARIQAIGKKQAKRNGEKLFKAEGPAASFELALNGYVGKFSPAERFAYTLPEAEGRQPYAVGFASAYSLFRAFLPAVVKANPDDAAKLQQLLPLLPEEGQGGIAMIAWKEKGVSRFWIRFGVEEFKAVSAVFAAATMLASDSHDDDDPDDDKD